MKKGLLTAVVTLTAVLEMVWGIGILWKPAWVSSVFLELSPAPELFALQEFRLLAGITGTSFIMLSVVSFFSVVLVRKDLKTGAVLALLLGIMITAVSLLTFINSRSPIVLLTDSLRGALMILFSVLVLKKTEGTSV